MKAHITAIVLLAATCFSLGEDVADPQANYLTDYHAGDYVKKFSADANGDGVADWFFTNIDANPDPAIKISDDQAGGSMSWDVYVSNPGANTFKVSTGVEIDGGLVQGAGLDVNPNQMFVGTISEINRYGIVTSAVKRSKSENSTIIYAYTWEADHFKRWKLAEYLVSQQNSIFNKYLKDGKRTQVTVQQIKP
jgi:hypothetical protein